MSDSDSPSTETPLIYVGEQIISRIIRHWHGTRFNHEVNVYIPVFQRNPKDKEDFYPTFTFNMQDGSSDEQEVLSLGPDYVLHLTGRFDATTKPFSLVLDEKLVSESQVPLNKVLEVLRGIEPRTEGDTNGQSPE